MRRSGLLILAGLLLVALVACQQTTPQNYGPQLDKAVASADAARIAAAEAADVAQANATSLAALRGDVQAIAASAQALASVPAQMGSVADVLHRVDPTTNGLLTVYYATPVTPTATPGACPAGIKQATTVRWGNEEQSIVFLGLPIGPVCLSSTDPAAGVTVHVTASQMLGVYYHVPTTTP